jgi:hypothetical protein
LHKAGVQSGPDWSGQVVDTTARWILKRIKKSTYNTVHEALWLWGLGAQMASAGSAKREQFQALGIQADTEQSWNTKISRYLGLGT